MSKGFAIGSSWSAEKTIDLGSGTTVDAKIGSFFKKDVAASVSLTIDNLLEGRTVSIIVRNTSLSPVTITLPSTTNSVDLVTGIPAGKFAVFKIIRAYGALYALSPIRSESYFA